jgi:asparagine synthase (glutamine-hydrolysing)
MSDRVYFASEIKAFLELPEFIKEVDQDSIYHYFTLGYIPGHRTPFKNIEELRSGHMIEFDLNHGTEKETRYYNIDYTPDLDSSIDGLTEGLLHQMRDSVQRNLISDVPVGVSLSGGFDSASILALAREHLGDKELHTYSIVMEEDSFNESSYQKLMVDFAKTTHHEVRVGAQEIATSLLNHIAFMDEPTSNGGAIPTYLLAAEAKKDVKVLLSGEGGDETFSAYDTYRAWKVRKLYRALVPSFARKGIQMLAHTMPINHQKLSFDFRCKRFTSGAELSVPESHVYWRHALTNTDKSAIMPDYKANTTTGSLFTSLYNEFGFDHELDRISALDIDTFFVGDLMTKNDRMLMAHSVEARFPYMDRKLFDHASKVPADIRLKGLKERYLQKRAMRGRLPKAIINRKKMGLEMPYSKWLLNQLRPQAEHYFSKSQIEKTGFLSHATVQRLWSEHEQKKRDNGRALWSILTFVIWNDLFIQSNSYKQYLR